MTKVNPTNGNETKSENFLWSLFKFDVIFSLIKKKYWSISITFKTLKGNETKSDIFQIFSNIFHIQI